MTEQSSYAEDLGKRIAILERQNRRMKWGAAFSVILLLGTIISCQTSQTHSQNRTSNLAAKTIEAEGIVLVSEGKVRARLEHRDEETSLVINDKEGNKRLRIGVGNIGGFMETCYADGQYSIQFHETGGLPSLGLYAPKFDHPIISIAGTRSGGVINVEKMDSRAGVRIETMKQVGLSIRDEIGVERVALGTAELENTTTGTTTKRAPSSLVLFNKEGKVFWSTP
jgi:hypothetical protein